MDIETINLDKLAGGGNDTIKLDDNKTSTIGIELLMNDKKKKSDNGSDTASLTADINLGDLNNLENELNDLSTPSNSNPPVSLKDAQSTLFEGEKKLRFNLDDSNNTTSGISSAPPLDNTSVPKGPTIKLNKEENSTWDGMKKFNDIPIDPASNMSNQPKLSPEELLREKFKYLRRLEALERKGADLSKKYTMDSSLLEMQGEYETLINEKERHNACKFQGRMLMAAITGLEFLNNKFDPFDLCLDGLTEQVNENIEEYDEIFSELHEKYKSKATMAPELKLLFQVAGSATMVHMTNTMFKSAMPGMDDIMRQNPELMQQFTQAAVNQMSHDSPGFGGFMNNMMNPDGAPPSGAPPPPPVRTQGPNSVKPPPRRPDIGFSRGPEDGINITQASADADPVQKSSRNGPPGSFGGSRRPEMKGPSDISSLLSGLKTKEATSTKPVSSNKPLTGGGGLDASSTISISELKEMSNANPPKKSKRRSKSDKNTISLDI